MKVRKAIDFDKVKQREVVVDFTLDKKQVREIVKNFFNVMDYRERQAWLNENVSKSKIILTNKEE
tara:strand:+ start:160 stop:354 length:195 start_codon:yes stop_codon:yes gene_type:complete